MGGPHHAHSRGHRAGPHLVDAQDLERCGGPDHVDDRVVATDLVEVDLVHLAPMEAGLDLGQHLERGEGAGRDPLGQPGLLDQSHDVGVGAAHDRTWFVDGDDRPGRCDPPPAAPARPRAPIR